MPAEIINECDPVLVTMSGFYRQGAMNIRVHQLEMSRGMGGCMLRHIRMMLFACNAWLTDQIRQALGFHYHPLYKVLIVQFPNILMVQVCKPSVPECLIKWI